MPTFRSLGPVLATTAFLLLPWCLPAQEAVGGGPGPRAGVWAAELGAGQGLSATLLRFRSPRTAWLLGLDGFFAQSRQEATDPFTGTSTETVTQVSLVASLGVRRYRPTQTALRPFTSIGLLGAITRFDGARGWDAGAFGELGASYFFSQHLSLGAAGQLQLSYGERRGPVAPGFAQETRTIMLGVSAVQLLAAVYF
jgi:hypothetical protein